MGPVQDREVAESAPARLSFEVFFYVNLIIVHKKLFLHLYNVSLTLILFSVEVGERDRLV